MMFPKYPRLLIFCLIIGLIVATGLVACGGGVMPLPGLGLGSSSAPSTIHPPGSFAPNTPTYWLSVSTANSTIPGMSEQGGLSGQIMGAITGAMGAPIGLQKTLLLQITSQSSATPPEANHDIPSGMKMGPTLPLVTPKVEPSTTGPSTPQEKTPWAKQDPPKTRIKFYWGCSPTVKSGQPRILDTSSMSRADFGKAMVGRSPGVQNMPSPRPGWIYGEWPNAQNSQKVPEGASLQGDHFVHGTYVPHIKFALSANQDFLAPVKFTAVTGKLDETITFQWNAIPQTIGSFAMAMAKEDKTGDMIIWSSSEVFEPGWGMMDFMPSQEVRNLVGQKVLMSGSTTSCQIPQGIFKDAGGAYLQFIAWGQDVELVRRPDWAVKARYKSTGMLMLGGEQSAAQPKEKKEEGGLLDKLKSIF